MDINKSYCGCHFTTYAYIRLLGCTPKTNTMLYFIYWLIKLGGGGKGEGLIMSSPNSCIEALTPSNLKYDHI